MHMHMYMYRNNKLRQSQQLPPLKLHVRICVYMGRQCTYIHKTIMAPIPAPSSHFPQQLHLIAIQHQKWRQFPPVYTLAAGIQPVQPRAPPHPAIASVHRHLPGFGQHRKPNRSRAETWPKISISKAKSDTCHTVQPRASPLLSKVTCTCNQHVARIASWRARR